MEVLSEDVCLGCALPLCGTAADKWSVDMAGVSLRACGQPEERLVVRVVLGHKCAPVDRVLFLVNGTGVLCAAAAARTGDSKAWLPRGAGACVIPSPCPI